MSPTAQRTLFRQGRLVPLRHGVARLAGVHPSWEQAVMAAVLAAGRGAVVSHVTAARLWGFVDDSRQGRRTAEQAGAGRIHLTCATQTRVDGVAGHRRGLGPAARTVRAGIPATTAEQTLVDVAAAVGATGLGAWVDDGLRRGVVDLGRLRRAAERDTGPGRGRLEPLRVVLAERLPGYTSGDSAWERRMDDVWDELGLPAAVRQHQVQVAGRAYRIDRAIPELRIGVEWDGYAFHGRYRADFDRASLRRAALQAAGWEILNVTSRWTPEQVRGAVMAVVGRRTVERQRTAAPPRRGGAQGAASSRS